MNEPMRIRLFGRCKVALPSPFEWSGQEATIDRATLEEIAFPAGSSADDAFRASWSQRLAKGVERGDLYPSRVLFDKELSTVGRVAEFQAIVPEADARRVPGEHVLEALIRGSKHALLVRYRWLAAPVGEEEDVSVIAAMRNARDRYDKIVESARFSPSPRPEADTFHLEHFALALRPFPPDAGTPVAESTRVSFVERARGLSFTVLTEEPFPEYHLGKKGRLAELARELKRREVGVETVHFGRRSVGTVRGDELIVHVRGRRELEFIWERSPPASYRGYDPDVRIEMRARDQNQEVARQVWDAALDSFEFLQKPTSP